MLKIVHSYAQVISLFNTDGIRNLASGNSETRTYILKFPH